MQRHPTASRTLRSLLIAGVLLGGLAPATQAHAAVIGSAEINDYYQGWSDWLGDPIGPVTGLSTQAPGAKRMYESGAIYWTEDTGPVVLFMNSLTKYQELGAEASSLGLPIDDSDLAAPLFQGGRIAENHVVNGVLLIEWDRNGRYNGPLGMPLDDSAITYMTVNVGGIPVRLVTTAQQQFVGATISYRQLRSPGWLAQPNPQRRAKVRVQVPYSLKVHNTGCGAGTRADGSRWVDLPVVSWQVGASGAPCGSGSHKLTPTFTAWIQPTDAGATTIEVGPFASSWRASDDPNHAGPTFKDLHHLNLPLGMEVTQTIGHTITGADAGDSMTVNRFTVTSTSVTVDDIVF